MDNLVARARRSTTSHRSLPTWAVGALAAAVALLLTITLAPPAQARPTADAPGAAAATSYVLQLPGGDVAFDSATGLSSGVPLIARVPIDLPRVVTLSGRVNSGTVLIRDWLATSSFTSTPTDLTVTLVGPSGQILHIYQLLDVLPLHWSVAAVDAGASAVAATTLVLSCRRVEVVS